MLDNLRVFKITQKFNSNGNRVTIIHDLRNEKKINIKELYIDDAEEIALEFFKKKNIVIAGKYEYKKDLYLLTHNFGTMIK